MLFVVFRAGGERYALEASSIVEVVPLVRLTPLPHAPPSLRGLFRFRGAIVPAVDLSVLTGGTPAKDLMSTRILVTRIAIGEGGRERFVGLGAEGVTGTLLRPEGPSPAAGLSLPEAPWLSGVLQDGEEMVPCLSASRVIPAELLDLVGSPDALGAAPREDA